MKDENQHIWQGWAAALQRWGLSNVAASFLESAGALNLLAAQAVYLGQPLVGRSISPPSLEALAHMLEDPQQSRAFANYLREVPQREPGA